jgi:uroporphyrin-III C-methyltransferase
MLAFQPKQKNVLVIGDNAIAASRVLSCLEADSKVYLVSKLINSTELAYRVEQGQVSLLGEEFDIRFLEERRFDLGFICHKDQEIEALVNEFRSRFIPLNVSDRPELCDFFMTSTYRDQSLQIAVSTNGQASKLSSRIKRHVASNLPTNIGDAVEKVGLLRKKVRQSDPSSAASIRRMKWLAQICEYWSMEKLALLSDTEMESLLESYQNDEGYESLDSIDPSHRVSGSITLLGSGTGDPDLLTMAAHKIIKEADLVLADKIVPAEVVALVECELKIARKFPGNANAAQEEFNEIALRAVKQGKNVVRLKQGGKFIYHYKKK